jgi:hypothetical protein
MTTTFTILAAWLIIPGSIAIWAMPRIVRKFGRRDHE